jgi:hypothetical protein
MAEQKESKKILFEDLSQAKKVMLVQTAMTPGFKVIIEMANEACLRATQDIAKLDPESQDYERKALERARRARNISEFSDLLFASIYGHVESVKKQEASDDSKAEEAVNNRFGIHPATKEVSNDAVMKTFGIHPAKPVKK